MLRALACALVASAAVLGLSAAATGTPEQTCRPTSSDGAGPFSGSGVSAPRRARIGTGHVLQGRVLRAPDCAPVAKALVILWQSSRTGYLPRGRGSVVTDRQGRFRFEGPVPYSYSGQPHIHIAVIHPAYEELLTRHVVPRGARSGRIRIVLAPFL